MIIHCPNCKTEHPEYFSTCPKCNFDRQASQRISSNQNTKQDEEYNQSLNIFDFSFSTFITPSLLKVVYGPMVILSVLLCIFGIIGISEISSFTVNQKTLCSVLAVIMLLHSIIVLRITCELCLVLFKIERNTRW